MFRRTPSRRPWPFWLLLLAWGCANLPAHAPLYAFAWLQTTVARAASPHAALETEVAALWHTGARENKIVRLVAEATARTPDAPADEQSSDSIELKKSLLEIAPESPAIIATLSLQPRPIRKLSALPAPAADVPSPPPRSAHLSV